MPLPITRTSPIMLEREAEITALDSLLAQVTAGRCRMALLTGEAGVGKSRMAHETARRCRMRGFDTLTGKCSERDFDFPFAPFVDALRQRLASTTEDPVTFLGPQASSLVELLPEHNHLVSYDGGDTTVSSEQSKRLLFENLSSLLKRLAAQRPLLLLLEDLHWSDPTSLELLELLPRRLEATQLLILGTCRANEASKDVIRSLTTLQRERSSQVLPLASLTPQGVSRMIGAMLPAPPPKQLIATVHARTGGNPFMIEELVALISETGPLPLTDAAVPTTVRDVVYQQIDGLGDTTLYVADLAAVASERVNFDFLLLVSGMERETFMVALRALVNHRIFTEDRVNGTPVIAFRHALTRDALLERLLLPERQSLHRVVAEALEADVDVATQPGGAGDLGFHFHIAEVWSKALTYSMRAGEAAWDVQASTEAFAHFRRALDAAVALNDDDIQATLYCRCGQALALLGAFEEASRYLQTALLVSRRQASAVIEQETLYALAGLFASRDYLTAHTYAEQAVSLARTRLDRAWEARALNRLGNVLTNLMRFSEGRRLHEAALTIVDDLNEQWSIADTLDHTGMSHYLSGEIPEARASFGKAAEIFLETGDSERAASALTSRGLYLAVLDGACPSDASPASNRSDAANGLRLSRDIGWRAGEAYALVALATVDLGDARYGDALEHAKAALAIASKIDHPQWRVIALLTLGLLHADLLDDATALHHFNQPSDLAVALGSRQWIERLEAWKLRCDVRLGLAKAPRTQIAGGLPANALPSTIGQRRSLLTRIEQERNAGRLESAELLTHRLLPADASPWPAEPILLRATVLAILGRRDTADSAFLDARRLVHNLAQRGCSGGSPPVAPSYGVVIMCPSLRPNRRRPATLSNPLPVTFPTQAGEARFSVTQRFVHGLGPSVASEPARPLPRAVTPGASETWPYACPGYEQQGDRACAVHHRENGGDARWRVSRQTGVLVTLAARGLDSRTGIGATA